MQERRYSGETLHLGNKCTCIFERCRGDDPPYIQERGAVKRLISFMGGNGGRGFLAQHRVIRAQGATRNKYAA